MSTIYFEDLEIGSVHLGQESVCDKDEMLEYSRRNDPWPFHVDEVAAAHSPFAADTLRAKVTVKDKRLSSKPGRGVITLFHEILNQRSEAVCTVEVVALLATRTEGVARDS